MEPIGKPLFDDLIYKENKKYMYASKLYTQLEEKIIFYQDKSNKSEHKICRIAYDLETKMIETKDIKIANQ